MADSDLETPDGLPRSPHAMTVDRVIAVLAGVSLLFVFLLPSQSGASFSTYMLALLMLAAGRERWGVSGRSRMLAGFVVALLIYLSSSVWWSADLSARGALSIYSRCVLILAFVVALSTSLRRVKGCARWLGRALAVGGGFAALAALINLHLHPTFDGRLVGLGQLRSVVIAALAFDAALLFALHVAIGDSARWRVVAGLCVAVLLAAIAATGSRSGYLGAAVGVWILLLPNHWTPRQKYGWLAWPLMIGATIGVVALVRPEYLATLFPRGDSFRLEIWSGEWQRLLARGPLFGLGILTRDAITVDGLEFAHPHSLYLASALQGGLVGLLLLLGVLMCTAWHLLRNADQRVARLGLALLAGGMSVYAFDGWELIDKVSVSWLVLWVPVAIAVTVEMSEPES